MGKEEKTGGKRRHIPTSKIVRLYVEFCNIFTSFLRSHKDEVRLPVKVIAGTKEPFSEKHPFFSASLLKNEEKLLTNYSLCNILFKVITHSEKATR